MCRYMELGLRARLNLQVVEVDIRMQKYQIRTELVTLKY